MNVQCVKETDHLLTYDTAWVAGYKCTSIELYFRSSPKALSLIEKLSIKI